MDIICLNRYNAWYSDGGQLELIQYQTIEEIKRWFHQYQRPLIYTEYGAGALAGLHAVFFFCLYYNSNTKKIFKLICKSIKTKYVFISLQLPSTMWSENYQVDIVHEHFNAFDAVKKLGFFIGEMMWNFADFHTPQGIFLV